MRYVMERFIENYSVENFDIIVIGGGITGSAVAYEAATRGLKVALLEKRDFGWATSSATSKMIHGGLRYLNNLEFGLVRESLKERRIMENIAPNFVYPMPLMVPNYRGFKTNKWILKAGLTLYDILAFDRGWTWDKSKKIPRNKTLSKRKALGVEPNIKTEKLTGASTFYDCQNIFPERLTLAFVKSAVKYGAKVANYAQVVDFLLSDGDKISGVRVRDVLKGKTVDIKGTLTVNCGGPWADIVLGIAGKGMGSHTIRRSEGIHIITRKLTNKYGVGYVTPKGRHFVIYIWRGYSLIGTTDKDYIGNPDDYRVSRKSIEELVDDVNTCHGESITYDDVLYAYGGMRPLVDEDTERTYESSRKYEIYDNAEDGNDGLITVEGGKYTTSRNLAVNVLKMIGKKLKRKLGKSFTKRNHLFGCEIKDMREFMDRVKREYSEFGERTVEYVAKNYGTECEKVFEIARKEKDLGKPLTDEGEILAEVVYAVKNEMARTLTDILILRTGFGTLGYPGDSVVRKIADIASRELKWSDKRKKQEITRVKEALLVPHE
jgi:glycerol-3-phosphate dehydrogenase